MNGGRCSSTMTISRSELRGLLCAAVFAEYLTPYSVDFLRRAGLRFTVAFKGLSKIPSGAEAGRAACCSCGVGRLAGADSECIVGIRTLSLAATRAE
jgi:hypothetical protein